MEHFDDYICDQQLRCELEDIQQWYESEECIDWANRWLNELNIVEVPREIFENA